MLLRHHRTGIDPAAVHNAAGFEHVSADALAVLHWLNALGVDYVLVGALARVARGEAGARGPVAIVPAPYGRNLDRLAHALVAAHARERIDVSGLEHVDRRHEPTLRLDASQLVRAERWLLTCEGHELDVEGRPDGCPSYQELLYEAVRVELAEGVAAEVAAPEDIEHYDHIRRTGAVPRMVVSRTS